MFIFQKNMSEWFYFFCLRGGANICVYVYPSVCPYVRPLSQMKNMSILIIMKNMEILTTFWGVKYFRSFGLKKLEVP